MSPEFQYIATEIKKRYPNTKNRVFDEKITLKEGADCFTQLLKIKSKTDSAPACDLVKDEDRKPEEGIFSEKVRSTWSWDKLHAETEKISFYLNNRLQSQLLTHFDRQKISLFEDIENLRKVLAELN
jgi:hypothetical protein